MSRRLVWPPDMAPAGGKVLGRVPAGGKVSGRAGDYICVRR